jgi:competence protein ComEA
MIKSKLVPIYSRFAPLVGRVSSVRRSGAATALALIIALGGGLLPGASVALAQEAQQAATPATVNINSADAEALASALEGVGHSRALEIVRYREAYGPFTAVEELTDVKGIGQSTLAKNMQVITLD